MTLYFQVQFLKLKSTENTKSTLKRVLKSERKKKVSSLKKYQGSEKKCKELKRDIIEIQSQEDSITKGKREIFCKKKIITKKKKKNQENPKPKKEYENRNVRKIKKKICKKTNIRKILNNKKFIKKKYQDNSKPKKNIKKKKKKNQEIPKPKKEYEKKVCMTKIMNQKKSQKDA